MLRRRSTLKAEWMLVFVLAARPRKYSSVPPISCSRELCCMLHLQRKAEIQALASDPLHCPAYSFLDLRSVDRLVYLLEREIG